MSNKLLPAWSCANAGHWMATRTGPGRCATHCGNDATCARSSFEKYSVKVGDVGTFVPASPWRGPMTETERLATITGLVCEDRVNLVDEDGQHSEYALVVPTRAEAQATGITHIFIPNTEPITELICRTALKDKMPTDATVKQELADSLRTIIKASGYRNKDVAAALGVSEASVSIKLNGETNLTIESINSLCKAAGARFVWNFFDIADPGPSWRSALNPGASMTPPDWSVFNSGAEVASGLSYVEALDYLTPERLERGWSLVCVVNKDNAPSHASEEA